MDWIDGRSLAEVIKQDGPMEWRTAALLISKVAMALQVAHESNIIHRDVKPANILLDEGRSSRISAWLVQKWALTEHRRPIKTPCWGRWYSNTSPSKCETQRT